MKRVTFLLFAATIFFTSCEKVIDVQLENNEQKLVIDAVLTDEEGGCMVRLSQTKHFSESNVFRGLSDATVTISDPTGNVFALLEEESGIYRHPTLKGTSNTTYSLNIEVLGKTYKAVSTMPQKVSLDSLHVQRQQFFDEEETFAHVTFQDPVAIKNHYRFKQFVNGKKLEGNFIMDDELSDGKQFQSTLYIFPEEDDTIKTGDEISVEMQCIDKAVYKYWYSYDQSATGSSQSAAPANPVSNIDGGALGYFSAHTVEVKKIYVP